MAPAATGTDTGGSIRQPAALAGVSGLKPTYGVVSRYGMVAFASSLDQGGPLAKSAADLALLMNAMAGFDARDSTNLDRPGEDYARGLNRPLSVCASIAARIFRRRRRSRFASPACAKRLAGSNRRAQKRSRSRSRTRKWRCRFTTCSRSPKRPRTSPGSMVRAMAIGRPTRRTCSTCTARTRAEGFGAEVKRRILIGTYVLSHGYYDAYYLQAQKVRRLIAQDFAQAFQQCDVIMGPTAPATAFRIGEKSADPVQMYLGDVFTVPASLAGTAGDLGALRLRFARPAGRPAGHRQPLRRGGSARRDAPLPAGDGLALARADGDAAVTWEIVVGIETHAQLLTKSKIFSGAATAFGAAPNTQASAVDIALPGVLPVLNRQAVELAIRFGLAVGGTISRRSIFARKNYFYPDSPKGYQISQYELPVVQGGRS
jgi:hypothetical protein